MVALWDTEANSDDARCNNTLSSIIIYGSIFRLTLMNKSAMTSEGREFFLDDIEPSNTQFK